MIWKNQGLQQQQTVRLGVVFFALISGLSAACAQGLCLDNGVLLSADDAQRGQVTYGCGSGQPNCSLKRKLLPVSRETWRLRTPDTSLLVSPATAWGYRLDGRTYRFGRTSSFELTHVGPICLYRYNNSRSVYYYFSRDLSSPLERLTPKNLKRVYADNALVQQAASALRWHQAPTDKLRPDGTMRVLSWFTAEAVAHQDHESEAN